MAVKKKAKKKVAKKKVVRKKAKKKVVKKKAMPVSLSNLLKKLSAAKKKYTKASEAEEAAKKIKTDLEEQVLKQLRKLKLDKATGAGLTVSQGEKDVVEEVDWDKLYKYIHENEAFDLLHKRISITAVTERAEDDEEVDGVTIGKLPKLNVSASSK